jgi:hypothetical protein
MTLARMQAECAAGGLGPCDTYRMIIGADSLQASLFYNASTPPGSFLGPKSTGFNGPIATIFAEAAPPPEDQWPAYASSELLHNGTRALSVYWHGSYTSVANEWYGVAAGSSVDLLYFAGSFDPIIVTASNAAIVFKEVYAPTAVAQAEGAAPVISKFLSGTLR